MIDVGAVGFRYSLAMDFFVKGVYIDAAKKSGASQG